MQYIKIIQTGIDVKEFQRELNDNNGDWKLNLDLVNQSKIHCAQNRRYTEKDIVLVGGPYKKGILEQDHSYNDWLGLCNVYDDPSVEFRKTELFCKYPVLTDFLFLKFPSLQKELVRIIISKLHPGETIWKHSDVGRFYRKNRFHFSIQGTYQYYTGDQQVTIHPGTIFWFDNKQEHWAENTGDVDRITVIFDIDPIYCNDLNLPRNSHRFLPHP
jgi:quercetin dioxygenase-like cupin family protein